MNKFVKTILLPCLALGVLATPLSAQAATPTLTVHPVMAPAQLEGKVNINSADTKQLELLPGIGPSTAQKIMEYRAKYPFKEALHLLRVKGVGRKTFAKIKPFLSVSGDSDLHVVKGK